MKPASKYYMVLLIGTCSIIWSSPSNAAPSPADCAAEADRAARGSGSIVGGVGVGAATGAVFGAIVGDSRKSTRRGAAIGAVAGGVHQGVNKNEVYKSVYDACMRRN